eukprot:1023811-Prorocentrum_minimum.AAC.4
MTSKPKPGSCSRLCRSTKRRMLDCDIMYTSIRTPRSNAVTINNRGEGTLTKKTNNRWKTCSKHALALVSTHAGRLLAINLPKRTRKRALVKKNTERNPQQLSDTRKGKTVRTSLPLSPSHHCETLPAKPSGCDSRGCGYIPVKACEKNLEIMVSASQEHFQQGGVEINFDLFTPINIRLFRVGENPMAHEVTHASSRAPFPTTA